ncbi:hypothetical protein BKA56DRAFT_678507 [Ilyonectria sp. MPI-CAGE-AT-0026]|nr:hypothetical protein BKA56DRAFT_678507 [Ilyonectria sp. MPI-CAGE-AT-0026]
MEALGVAASIIAVVQVSKQVIDMCTKYIEGVQDAPKDLRHILIEVSALKGLFEPLKVLVGFDEDTAVLDTQLSAPVKGCHKAVQELDSMLGSAEVYRVATGGQDEDQGGGSRGKRRRLANLKIQLAWPLKQERAKRLLDLLSAYKSTINLILSSHGISQLQKIGHEMSSFRATLDSAGRAKILNWLVTVNPSFNHNQALDLHQDGTCKWVLMSMQWLKWKLDVKTGNPNASRGIWIHGIPGAGKTILASFLAKSMARISNGEDDDKEIDGCCIEARLSWAAAVDDQHDDDDDQKEYERECIKKSPLDMMNTLFDMRNAWISSLSKAWISSLSKLPSDVGHEVSAEAGLPKLAVYYYCHHARDYDEKNHFLAWLLSQLCRKARDIPENICNLFESDCRPHSDHLVEAIKTMAPRFSRILVSIDAVDESQNRDALVSFLKHLACDGEFSRFHVVVTSRREMDIERHLGAFTWLSMSNYLVNLDIAKYVEEQLQTDRSLQRFSVKLRDGIKQSLLSRAKGMFRLVICQLQVLKRIPVESAALKALEQLPETLDETYERILVGVPLGWAPIVRRAFCLLTSTPMVHIKELVTFASAIDSSFEDSMAIEEWEGEPSEEAFLEVMGCLISITPGLATQVRLAHYTIKEYLGSPRIAQSSACFFYLPTSEAMGESVRTMLRVVTMTNDGRNDESWRQFKDFCEDKWLDLVKMDDTVIASDNQLTALVVKAIPLTPCSDVTFRQNYSGEWPRSSGGAGFDRPDVEILITLISEDLYAITTAVLLQYTAEQATSICLFEVGAWNNLTVAGWLAESHRNKYLLLVLERCGSQINNHRHSLLICAMLSFRRFDNASQTLKALISAKVSVNPEGMRVTPLQLAVSQIRVDVIKTLLDNGADPNAVGHPEGWTLKQLRHFEGGMTPLHKIRMMRSHGNVDTWFDGAKSDVDTIEELLLSAGGRESCAWLAKDYQMQQITL